MPAKKKIAKKKVTKKAASEVTSKRNVKGYPKTVGGISDRLLKQSAIISDLNKQITAAKAEKENMIGYALELLKKSDLEGAKGKLGQVSISHTAVPQVEPDDWPKLFKHILKTKDFALLQKRLAVTHIRDLWSDGESVPGIGTFNKVSLAITKVKK